MENRPITRKSKTIEYALNCGKMYVTIAYDSKNPVEVFITKGHNGFCGSCIAAGLGRLCFLSLHGGIGKEDIIKQLKGITCENGIWEDGIFNASCIDVLAKALEYEGS